MNNEKQQSATEKHTHTRIYELHQQSNISNKEENKTKNDATIPKGNGNLWTRHFRDNDRRRDVAS
jgi:hypothetical protein